MLKNIHFITLTNYIYFRTQLDSHESNIDLLEHRLEKVI